MINAWSLAYDVLNGTLDENFPIKKKPMTDEIKLTGADEGVVNVPKGLEYNDPTHYVDGQGDIHLATSKDDLKVIGILLFFGQEIHLDYHISLRCLLPLYQFLNHKNSFSLLS